jgi:hypothetical protein
VYSSLLPAEDRIVIVFNKNPSDFFHSLIPADLQRKLDPHSSTYMRVQALSALLVIMSVLGAVSCVVMEALHLLLYDHSVTYELMLVGATTLFILQTVFFYSFSNYWVSGIVFTIFYFLISTLVIIFSGGYDAPGKVFLLTCPMVAFLLSGWRDGVQTATLIMLFGLVLAALKSIGFELPNIFNDQNEQIRFIFSWVFTIATMALCCIIYESELQYRYQALEAHPDGAQVAMPIQFENWWNGFLHQLVPVGLREQLDIQSWQYARVQIFTVLLWSAMAVSAACLFLFVPIHLLLQPEILKYDLVIVVVTMLFALQVWAFYRFQNFGLSSLVLGYLCFFMVLALVYLSGGYNAPAMLLLVTIPVVFFIIGGIRDGFQNAMFVAVAGAAFGLLKYHGFEIANIFNDNSLPVIFAIIWMISVTGITLCLLAYDTKLESREDAA